MSKETVLVPDEFAMVLCMIVLTRFGVINMHREHGHWIAPGQDSAAWFDGWCDG